MDRVAEMGCIICGAPAQLHHWRVGNERRNDLYILPLCQHHHTGEQGIHGGVKSWEMAYGDQRHLFAKVLDQLARKIR